MEYDFSSVIERHGMDASAVDCIGRSPALDVSPEEGFDAIPMWVADMNFATCPSVAEAMRKRLEHPLFGYFEVREEYYEGIIRWQSVRNHVEGLKKENIGYANGVLGGNWSALRVLTTPGDSVLVTSPVYPGFGHGIPRQGRQLVRTELKRDDQGVWRIDYEDMEQKIIENKIHVMVFCNPHNPCGRVWERREIEKVAEICEKHSVWIISDEIWSDIIRPDLQHIPTQSVNEYAKMHTIAVYAITKTFNLAGLVGSYYIIYNSWLMDRVQSEDAYSGYDHMNVLSMHALIGAYTDEGIEWTRQMNQAIADNTAFACDFIREHLKGVDVMRPEGTYMLFLDCEKYCRAAGRSIDDVIRAGWRKGVDWQDGRMFFGDWNIRVNLALPMCRVKEAFDRMEKYVFV